MAQRRGGGRPRKEIDEKKAVEYARLGFTADQIAAVLGVASSTYRKYVDENAAFSATVKGAKDEADGKVIRSLYQRAIGGTWGGKEYPPETMAMIYWLNNRQPKDWKQRKIEVDIPEGKRLIIEDAD